MGQPTANGFRYELWTAGTDAQRWSAADVFGPAVAGTLNFESGTYGLGNVSNNGNSEYFSLAGTLGVGQANLLLIDPDGVDLGSSTTLAGGTLTSPTEITLDSNDEITGHGRLFGDLALGANGTVAGSGSRLGLYGDVSGSGSIIDAQIYGNLTIGNSPGVIRLEDVILSASTITEFSIEGTGLGEYDRLILTGDVTLAGTALILFAEGVDIPIDSTFQLVDFSGANLTGWFDDVQAPSGWIVNSLGVFVPKPGTGSLLALGLVGLALHRRSSRVRTIR